MTVQITIIGLGQMGASIGLALAAHKQTLKRVGHDKNLETARAAQKAGAVDAIHFNLPASVDGADAVILALPLNEVRDTLNYIRADLKEGAVVLDVSPARREAEAWAREILPPGRHYVGLAAAVNPKRLLETGGGLEAAHADLFADAVILVCPQPGAPEGAARLGTDLVRLLGATPLLSDASEADGLLSAMSTLPKLLAVSLAEATMEKPGWQDAKNLADRSYAMPLASAFDRDEAEALTDAALANRDNLLRLLDGYVEALQGLRGEIEDNDRAALSARLHAVQKKAHAWLAERHLEKYTPAETPASAETLSSPSLGERVRQMFLGGWKLPGGGRGKK